MATQDIFEEDIDMYTSTSNRKSNAFLNISSSTTNQTFKGMVDVLPSAPNATDPYFVDVAQHSEPFPSQLYANNANLHSSSGSTANQLRIKKVKLVKGKVNANLVDEFASNYIATNPHVVDVAQHSEPFPSKLYAKNANLRHLSSATTSEPYTPKFRRFNLSKGFNATNAHLVDVALHSEPFPSSSKAINNNFNNSSSSSTNQTHNKLNDLLPSNSDSANADFIDVAQHSASFHSSLNTTSTVLNNAATSLTNEGTFPTTNENIMAILQTILQKHIDLEFRLTKIEEKLPELAEVMAIYKVMRDSKVLIKKTHKIVCRISGETENDTHTELSIVMPLTSLDSVYDIEKKLDSDDYQESMKSYIFMLKGALSDIIGVMRKLFSDNVLFNFNWDGVQGKRSLSKLKLVNSVVFDVFKLQGRINFEDSMRRCLTLSHNRHKQRRYLINKSSSATA
ncbi:uncharacterized protein [Eurosta solidaginis]|uniref:uncharacterized protein isoform X2 n=2 Tax=Eurosta solidaginis TaxID=178769 RepID=UPI00353163E8